MSRVSFVVGLCFQITFPYTIVNAEKRSWIENGNSDGEIACVFTDGREAATLATIGEQKFSTLCVEKERTMGLFGGLSMLSSTVQLLEETCCVLQCRFHRPVQFLHHGPQKLNQKRNLGSENATASISTSNPKFRDLLNSKTPTESLFKC